jgi:DNA-binding NtrC family response regulator
MTRQTRILIADDDLDALYYVDDVLAELGCCPIKVTTLDDAADVLATTDVDALVVNMAIVAAASEQTMTQLESARDRLPVLVMARPGREPDGADSPLRCFLEHPPAVESLAEALERCLAVPAGPRRA